MTAEDNKKRGSKRFVEAFEGRGSCSRLIKLLTDGGLHGFGRPPNDDCFPATYTKETWPGSFMFKHIRLILARADERLAVGPTLTAEDDRVSLTMAREFCRFKSGKGLQTVHYHNLFWLRRIGKDRGGERVSGLPTRSARFFLGFSGRLLT